MSPSGRGWLSPRWRACDQASSRGELKNIHVTKNFRTIDRVVKYQRWEAAFGQLGATEIHYDRLEGIDTEVINIVLNIFYNDVVIQEIGG